MANDDEPAESDPPAATAADAPAAPAADAPAAKVTVSAHHEEIDDSDLSKWVRRFDDTLGFVERAFLFATLLVLIGVNLYRLILDLGFKERPLWAIEVSRVSAFAIGLLGAAYAAQSRRNFGLDLVSALMSRKFKAVTRVFTNVAAFLAAGLLYYGGRVFQGALGKEQQHYELIPTKVVGWFIPIAAVLIMVHVACHIVIEIDYLRRGKTAPEPEVVG